MSRLQKAAWFNLGASAVCTVAGISCIIYLAHMNAKGIVYILICLIITGFITPWLYLFYRKKSIEAGFDEREKMINKRAFILSAFALTIFLGCVCFIPFFILGGQNIIKVFYLPLIFLGSIFTAQFAHSTAILIQCALEEEDEQ